MRMATSYETNYSNRSVKAAQLLGYNSSTLPALVFYDGNCQWELFDHSVTALYNPQSLVLSNEPTDGSTDFQLLWVQPQTGGLCVGPRGPELECQFMLADLPSPIIDVCNSEDPLPIDAYQDENIVHYFSRAINDQDFIDWFFTRAHFDVLQADLGEAEVRSLSSSNGAIYSDSRGKLVARCEDISKSCRWTTTYIRVSSGKLERSRTQMADGSIRFTFTSPKQFHICFGHEFGNCRVQEALLRLWLSQAHRVFDHLNMSRNDARQCLAMTRKVYTSLEGNGPESASQRNPWFLFIRPFPSTPTGQPDFAAWTHGNMVHWSSDASGRTWVLNDAQQTPGFPKITPQIKTLTYKWDDIIYGAARRIQEFKGFDPRTRDFARSLELPAFEVEFEDAEDEDDMDVDGCEIKMDVD
ncbi:hypothetical protein VNI00_006632 [Paramarasmius palmivorus]|uniref:Uncharacterized protein n=1 Tax=Paramarasmius palmivorus TaxID=297713 RepID=A0AAW0D535_9AGAR